MGQNREGATAAILSTTKLEATTYRGDSALDLGLLPSAVKGDDGLEAMYGLLRTFMDRNGHALQINVLNADTLRDAQAHPEKYPQLTVRVSGYAVNFIKLTKEQQDEVISRTFHEQI